MSIQSFTRVNGKIRAREVRTIDADGKTQLGILPLTDALRRAQQLGLDLVEIAANAQPPVCRIMDFGKFRYEQARKERESRKHHHATKVKELKFHANISEHDYGVKLRHIREFLQESIRVKISLFFRGREMAHMDIGQALMKRLLHDCADIGHAEMDPKLIGRSIHMMLAPRPASKRGAKHTGAPEPQSNQAASSDTVTLGANPSGFVNAPKIVITSKQQS